MAYVVAWPGKSGKKYQFEIYAVGQEFNPVSGVYIFCRIVGPDTFEALYVGETQSLHDRLNTGLMNHDGFKRASKLGASFIGVMRADGYANRLGIETDLRHGIDPICNRQEVPMNRLLTALYSK